MSIANKDRNIWHRQRLESGTAGADCRTRCLAVYIASLSPLAFETSFSVGKLFYDVNNKNSNIEKRVARIIDSQPLYREVTATTESLRKGLPGSQL